MTYAKRRLEVKFTNPETSRVLKLTGYRCGAFLQNVGAGLNSAAQAQLRIFGMSLDEMNEFSSTGQNPTAYQQFMVTISAGNVGAGEPMTQVFEGTIIRSFIDFASVPDVSFVVSGVTAYFEKTQGAASNSYPGSHNAEDIIQSLAAQINFEFRNFMGAHAVLQNQQVYGSVVNQIQQVAQAASFPITFENGAVYLWPNEKYRDSVIIDVNAQNGLVGYPSYWQAGFEIKTEFNASLLIGRRVNLKSIIPKSNGVWPIQMVSHDLSTLTFDGPWFSTARLAPAPYVPTN